MFFGENLSMIHVLVSYTLIPDKNAPSHTPPPSPHKGLCAVCGRGSWSSCGFGYGFEAGRIRVKGAFSQVKLVK
jgi:hypothetical protein